MTIGAHPYFCKDLKEAMKENDKLTKQVLEMQKLIEAERVLFEEQLQLEKEALEEELRKKEEEH